MVAILCAAVSAVDAAPSLNISSSKSSIAVFAILDGGPAVSAAMPSVVVASERCEDKQSKGVSTNY